MEKEILWFKSGDGKELSCTEGSVAFDLMSKDGSFKRITGPGEDPVGNEETDDDKLDLTKLNKKQLFEHAALNDVPVTAKMKNEEIIAAIEAKAKESEEKTEDDE